MTTIVGIDPKKYTLSTFLVQSPGSQSLTAGMYVTFRLHIVETVHRVRECVVNP